MGGLSGSILIILLEAMRIEVLIIQHDDRCGVGFDVFLSLGNWFSYVSGRPLRCLGSDRKRLSRQRRVALVEAHVLECLDDRNAVRSPTCLLSITWQGIDAVEKSVKSAKGWLCKRVVEKGFHRFQHPKHLLARYSNNG